MGIRGWNSVEKWLRVGGISLALAILASSLPAGAAQSIGQRVGPEYFVSGSRIAVAPNGRFVAVGGTGGCGASGFVETFDELGRSVSGQIQFTPPCDPDDALEATVKPSRAVAIMPDGSFVVLWGRRRNDRDGTFPYHLYASGYSFQGALRFGPVEVTSSSRLREGPLASVAVMPSGEFVAAWHGDTSIYARRFSATGLPLTLELPVSTPFPIASPFGVDVAVLPNGNALVVWNSFSGLNGTGPSRIFRRVVFPNGSLDFSEVLISAQRGGSNSNTPQNLPQVASAGNSFAIAWQESAQFDGFPPPENMRYQYSIRYRRLSDTGLALADTVDAQVTPVALTPPYIYKAGVNADAKGRLVVTWVDYNSSKRQGRYFDVSNSPLTPILNLGSGNTDNSDPNTNQAENAVNANGDLVSIPHFDPDFCPRLNTCASRFAGSEPVDLSLSSTLTAGTYNLVVRNLHPVESPSGVAAVDAAVGLASNVAVSFPLPTNIAFSASGTGWSCARSGTKVTCSLNRTLAPASTAAGLGIRITSPQCQNGTVDTTFTLDANQFDAVQGNNQQAATCTSSASPGIRTNVTSFNFGSVRVGQSSVQRMLVISNTGTAPLRITSIRLAGDYTGSSGCSAPVAPGGSCTLTGSFRPTATGPRPGSVTIISNAPTSPTVVTLSGTGT